MLDLKRIITEMPPEVFNVLWHFLAEHKVVYEEKALKTALKQVCDEDSLISRETVYAASEMLAVDVPKLDEMPRGFVKSVLSYMSRVAAAGGTLRLNIFDLFEEDENWERHLRHLSQYGKFAVTYMSNGVVVVKRVKRPPPEALAG